MLSRLVRSSLEFILPERIDQGYRPPITHYTTSGRRKSSVKTSLTTTNCVAKGKKNELSVSNSFKHQVKNRIILVDRELEVMQ